MSIDCSRFGFRPEKDYSSVLMQQGRVQLDSDWNESEAILARRLQSGTLDALGRAVVPRSTPDAFRIIASAGALSIGLGRMYVDGLLAENHGGAPLQWDQVLAELTGTAGVPFFEQPYLPFNPADQPDPAGVFNRPALTSDPCLVYLDVWQRELTHLQDPDLVEKAVGVDTTGRLQTVWQVRVLPGIAPADCSTPDAEIPGWAALTAPSGGRLTTAAGTVPGDDNPCLAPPAAGYKGLENQLYRVEIHRGGPVGTATFKWSRDNATVATRVTEIQGNDRLVVESIGRDDVLGFQAGDWVEVLDDWHELHGRRGILRRVRLGDGVDAASRSILLEDPLPSGLFPVDAQGRTEASRHTRIRRWDQHDVVRRSDGSVFHDLNASASSDGIPVPPAGTQVALEHGILVEFAVEAAGEFKTSDYWVFAARAADASLEVLDRAPPRGIHHHYARLAVVTLPDTANDCRVLWPPEPAGGGCDCTLCVNPEGHNAGAATIQQAIDSIRTRGGTICLDAGTYRLATPLNLEGVQSMRIRGQGWRTVLQSVRVGAAIEILQAVGITIENLAVLGAAEAGGGTTALISAANCVDLRLSRLAVLAVGADTAADTAVGLSGVILAGTICDCTFATQQGVVALPGKRDYLLTANLRVIDNVFLCSQRGVVLAGLCLHYGELLVARNVLLNCADTGINLTGAVLAAGSVTVEGNLLRANGTGMTIGTSGARIADNEVVGDLGEGTAHGIVLASGIDPRPMDAIQIIGNRLHGLTGSGIVVRRALGKAMVKANVLDSVVGAGLVMEEDASAAYLCIENNQFIDLGIGFNDEARPYIGLQVLRVERLDVVGNVFAGVARQASQSPLRAAVLAVSASDIRIAGNRMFGIGPARFLGRTVGVAVTSRLRQLTVEDNSIARIDDAAETPSPASWQAVAVTSSAANPNGTITGGVATPPGIALMPIDTNHLYLSAFHIAILRFQLGGASLRGNHLRGQATNLPIVDIEDVNSCLFDQNDGELTDTAGGNAVAALGRIRCDHIGAANNRLIGMRDVPSLLIETKHFAVLGNLTRGSIQVNGGALPPPWDALNVVV